ncbi:MAG: type II toxin-antitoxin system VapC family toxin [Ardenticatenaceae bacterium]|nr:type II toxin-antitoxin system VapC family toxin [Ardenticatenaceae bacterium]
MKLLLDTHAFIWWYNEPQRLPAKVLAACQNVENSLLLSVVSAWEMQIKVQLGKLRLARPLPEIIRHQQEQNQLQVLPITLPVVYALDNLPLNNHRDPFDRLLIAQAQVDQLLLVSNDSQFGQYAVSMFWK